MSKQITLPINYPIPPKGGIMLLDGRVYRVMDCREVPATDGELDGYPTPEYFLIQAKFEDVTDTEEGQALLDLQGRRQTANL